MCSDFLKSFAVISIKAGKTHEIFIPIMVMAVLMQSLEIAFREGVIDPVSVIDP